MRALRCPACAHASDERPGARCPRDGRVLVTAATLVKHPGDAMLGTAIDDRYLIYDVIGAGGMGSVYKAIQRPLGRVVAVKTIRPRVPASGEAGQIDPEQSARFLLEARLQARLDNPGLVAIFDFGTTAEGVLYMVQAFVDGASLQSIIDSDGALSPARALGLAAQIAAALASAHDAGLLHRDIKPANVMVQDDRRGAESVRVIDFGIAKVIDEERAAMSVVAEHETHEGTLIGTPSYMAPEQLGGAGTVGPQTDVYAIGATLYQMLTGEPPYRGATFLQIALKQLHSPVPTLPVGALTGLQPIIERAMAKEPADRWADGGAMAAALRQAIEDLEPGSATGHAPGGRLGAAAHAAPDPFAATGVNEGPLAEPEATPPSTSPLTPARQAVIRPALVALAGVMLLGVGWWAWHPTGAGNGSALEPGASSAPDASVSLASQVAVPDAAGSPARDATASVATDAAPTPEAAPVSDAAPPEPPDAAAAPTRRPRRRGKSWATPLPP